jgi:hypothetical protein
MMSLLSHGGWRVEQNSQTENRCESKGQTFCTIHFDFFTSFPSMPILQLQETAYAEMPGENLNVHNGANGSLVAEATTPSALSSYFYGA